MLPITTIKTFTYRQFLLAQTSTWMKQYNRWGLQKKWARSDTFRV